MTRAEVTRRHDSRAQLRRRHTLAVAVTVAGTYANATLREAVALPRSSCGPFVQLAARGRVTHDMISSHRMRLLPDAIRRQWPCCSRVDGSEWSDVKKTKSVTRPKSAEGGPRVRPTRPRRCACTCAAGGPSSGTYRETLLQTPLCSVTRVRVKGCWYDAPRKVGATTPHSQLSTRGEVM